MAQHRFQGFPPMPAPGVNPLHDIEPQRETYAYYLGLAYQFDYNSVNLSLPRMLVLNTGLVRTAS
ncbi:hypothetical protein FG05_35315 [Fusarium graminearum]|nr:hypothetical protein FG05_35315 [Fusarium graminearum]